MGVACTLCPRCCNVPRPGGYCGASAELEVASVCLHRGEEPPISGTAGIVNIFFQHCNLRCIFCQNWQITEGDEGERHTVESLADLIVSHRSPMVGFVTAAHYAYAVPSIVEEVRRLGFNPVIVYNSSGYESVETLRNLEGYVDVYLPDLKYMDAGLAAAYSNAPDYPEVASAAIMEMKRQVGASLKLDSDGMAYRGLLVRHLVLPGAVDNACRCLQWMADNLSPSVGVSLMAQYFPPRPGLPAPLDLPLLQEEYDAALACLDSLPFTKVWTQSLCAQQSYRPDFTRQNNPFES